MTIKASKKKKRTKETTPKKKVVHKGKGTKSSTINIRITPVVKSKWQRLAKKRGVSLAVLAEQLICDAK